MLQAGRYNTVAGTPCKICDGGKYNTQDGLSSCTNCPEGWFREVAAQNLKEQCLIDYCNAHAACKTAKCSGSTCVRGTPVSNTNFKLTTNTNFKLADVSGNQPGDYPWVLYSDGQFHPICGRYFWNNDNGADTFCRELGYENGGVLGEITNIVFSTNAVNVGECNAGEALDACTGGGNNAWDNMNYGTNFCHAGQNIGVKVQCSGFCTTYTHATYGPMKDWDMSLVTDLSFLFFNKGTMNADLSSWDVSGVTTMRGST